MTAFSGIVSSAAVAFLSCLPLKPSSWDFDRDDILVETLSPDPLSAFPQHRLRYTNFRVQDVITIPVTSYHIEDIRRGANPMEHMRGAYNKFLVCKQSDIQSALTQEEELQLRELMQKIENHRLAAGKKQNSYLVVNADEQYAPDVISILKAHGHWGEPQYCYD